MFVGSPTKLTTWVDCPARYRLTYVDRAPPGPPWAHLSFGTSVHNALRDWYLLEPDERTPAAAADLVRRDWVAVGFRDDAQSAHWRERASAMVRDYVTTLDPHEEPAGVERSVALRTDAIGLNGRADRIDDRPSATGARELVVVDYKTNRLPPTVDDVRSSLALAIYAAATWRTLRRACRRVELHHLPSGRVVGWEHDDASLRRHLRRAEDIAADAARAEETARTRRGDEGEDAEVDDLFPARPGPACGYCDVVRSCAAGVAETQAVLRAPWDVLERWESEPGDGPGAADGAGGGATGGSPVA